MKSVAVDNARTGKKIKSLRIENQVIDDGVSISPKIFAGDPGQVYFVNCSFSESGEWILCEFPSVSKVGFILCNLSHDALEELLQLMILIIR